MPVDSSTYQKYYNALQQAYGKNGTVEKGAFNLGFDDFKQKLANQDYAQKIYGALDQAYGKQGAVEKGAFTLPFHDFYGKVSKGISQPQSTPASPQVPQQPAQPLPTAPNINDIFRQQPSESTNIPGINLPLVPPTGTAIDQHSKEIDRAFNNVTQVFNQNKDKAISNILSGDLKQQQDRLNSAYQDGQIDEKTFNEGKKQLFNRMVNPGADIANFKQEMASDPSKVRHVVDVIAKTNPDQANQLKADMYLMDSKNRPEKSTMILHNAKAIAGGQGLDYDIKQGVLKGQEGFFQSLGQGFSERNRMMNDYGFYTNETPDKIINKLEGQRASYDPDLPVNMPYGIGGHLGQAIGSQGIVTAKGAAAGAVTSLIPGVGDVAAPWAAAAVTSPEFYKTGYVSSLENEYHRLRNNGVDPKDALSKAQEKASFDAKVDVAQGAIGTAVGARIGLKPGEFTPTFENTIKNIAVHSGKWLTETGMEGGANALLATGLQELKNIHAGRPAEEGAFETGMGQLMFAYGLGALTKVGRSLLNPKAYRSVLQTMARAPENEINTSLASMVIDGSISNEDAADVHSQLNAQRAADSKIPPEVTNDNDRAKIQDMISERDALDAKMEAVDKAYHPELKEQIKALNEKIAEASKNPSEPPKAQSTEPTFASPEDQQQLHDNEIISQLKPPTNGEETKGNAEAEKVGPPEGAVTQAAAAPSFLQSRHADTIHDEEGIVSGPNNKELSTKGKRDANDLANDVEGKGVTNVITSGLERSKETGQKVADKVGATVENRPELNTWDIHDFDGLKDEEFKDVQKWFVEHPDEITYRGPIEKYEGKQVGESINEYAQRIIPAMERIEKESGPETLLINHSNNMMLWDAFLKNGREWNDQTRQDYLHSEKPEPATLTSQPKVSYPKITNVKLKENAIQEHAAGEMGVRDEAAVRQEMGGPNGPEQPPQDSGQQPAQEENQGAGEKETIPPVHGDDWPFIEPSKTGVAARIKKEREFDAGVKAPEEGKGISKQEMVNLGRKLLEDGRNPEQVMKNFENDPEKNISTNAMALSVAHLEQLAKATDKAVEDYGEDSKEADAARLAESEWESRVQPMQTEWHKIGQGQTGATEVDTGTVASLKRSFREVSGKPLTAKQSAQAKEYHDILKQREARIADLETQLDKIYNPDQPTKTTTFTEKTKKAADAFRKTFKTKEFSFKDSNGNDVPIQKMGISWNDLVEVGAKAIEKTGEIADGISAILDKVKEADWYKNLSKDDQDRFGKELEDHYANIADKKTASRIKSLEKQLADIESGKVKEKGIPRKETDKEKELKDQIFEAKKNLGLIKSKSTPTPKTPIVKPNIDIATHFVDKKDNNFTLEESKAVWEHTKEVIKGGKDNFHNVIQQVGMDTGLSNEQVRRAISQPKGAKVITDKIYAEMYKRNQVLQSTKIWVKSADLSESKKFWSKVIKVPSAIVTALHGSVAPITHVGTDLYRPENWKSYFKFMTDSYRFSFGGITDAGKARYEKAMDDLTRDPMYPIALQSGVRCDPTDLQGDDYSNYQSVFGRLSKMGERGFNAMKPYRLEQFKKLYSGLADQAKGSKDVRKAIGNIVNLSSGTTTVKTGKYTDLFVFAPKLITSQYQRIFSEPYKAVSTLVKGMRGKPITDAEKLQASMVAKHSAQMVATYLVGLAANQAILSLTGSKQSINFLNPLSSDWMKYKVAGKTIDASGGMNSALRFVGSLVEEGLRANGVLKTQEKGKPGDTEGRKILQQASNKLSPAAADVAELFSGTDNNGNSLPWSSVKPSASREKLTWAEYFESKTPIFLAEGFKTFNESAKENGMPSATLNNYLEGVVVGVLSGTTGAHIQPDISLKPKKSSDDRGGSGGGGGAGGDFDR